jgi:hypothetical protein
VENGQGTMVGRPIMNPTFYFILFKIWHGRVKAQLGGLFGLS